MNQLGGIVRLEDEIVYIDDGESFYKAQLYTGEGVIPLVISEYLLKDVESGESVILEGTLSSTFKYKPKNKLFTFFLVKNITKGKDDINTIQISGKIQKSEEFIPGDLGVSKKKFVLRPFASKRKVLVHLLALGKYARKYKDLPVGSLVTVTGMISAKKGPINIIVKEVKAYEEV